MACVTYETKLLIFFFFQKGLAFKCMHDSVGLKVHNKVFKACK